MPRRLLPCLACLSLACAAGSRDTEGAGLTPTGASSSTAALTDDATEDVSTDSSETDATAGST
ncbi:MAG: hypothetical protein KC636_19850, partial [Myxococcales bacterium]|nr:hypothetical protein [Myxococcales bacterium]